MIKIGWEDLSPAEALDFGFEQAGRYTWQIFRVEMFGYGIALMARVKP